MTENKGTPEIERQEPPKIEERSIDVETVAQLVEAGATVVAAGATTYIAAQSGKPSESPPPEPEPKIELPPGVEQD